MSERQEKHMRAWEAIRTKGKWNFVLKRGVLGFGAVMLFVSGIVAPYLLSEPNAFTPQTLATKAAVSLIGGFAWGMLAWFVWDKQYGKRRLSVGNNP